MDKIKELQRMIDECNNIVVFTGAGVSTDSGLKDFRGKDGFCFNNCHPICWKDVYVILNLFIWWMGSRGSLCFNNWTHKSSLISPAFFIPYNEI